MKNIAFALIALVALSTSASAKDAAGAIVNVTPIVSESFQQPQQVCDMVHTDINTPTAAANSGTVIGGIAGALLGAQVGGGNGRVAMSALGAVTGAVVGDRMAQKNNASQQNCRWVERPNRQISGYRVLYQYQGEIYEETMPYDPSNSGSNRSLQLQVSVSVR